METPTDQPSNQTSKAVQWYQALNQLPTPTRDLFLQYVGFKSEDAVKEHLA